MMVATQLRRLLGPATREAADDRTRSDDKVLLWVRLVPPEAWECGTLEGAVLLMSPMASPPIADEAQAAHPRARLEVTVPAAIDDARFASVREQLAWLSDRGVDVEVSRGQRPQPQHRHLALASTDGIMLHVGSAAVASRLSRPGQL
jgi:hypothetical protein